MRSRIIWSFEDLDTDTAGFPYIMAGGNKSKISGFDLGNFNRFDGLIVGVTFKLSAIESIVEVGSVLRCHDLKLSDPLVRALSAL